jgi:hypothetical protein
MSEPGEPFTGAWKFNAQRSKISTQLPQNWVQRIIVTRDEVHVSENIVRPDGSRTDLEVHAKFDGMDHPVRGSPVADTIAYIRLSSHTPEPVRSYYFFEQDMLTCWRSLRI